MRGDQSAPSPEEVYERAEAEGARRLDMPLLEKVAAGFIAGGMLLITLTHTAQVKARK
jgi:hypothetical protein